MRRASTRCADGRYSDLSCPICGILNDPLLDRFDLALPRGELWIFGYGSLMWDPGFPYVRSCSALLRGYHRTFCVYSHRYRGTPEQPGLVLGLDRGGACRGVGYLVAEQQVECVLESLWAREMSRRTYQPRMVRVDLSGTVAKALAFIADPAQPSYAGRLAAEEIAVLIARGIGARGANIEYLANTLRHLEALGVQDPHLHKIFSLVQEFTARSLDGRPARPTAG